MPLPPHQQHQTHTKHTPHNSKSTSTGTSPYHNDTQTPPTTIPNTIHHHDTSSQPQSYWTQYNTTPLRHTSTTLHTHTQKLIYHDQQQSQSPQTQPHPLTSRPHATPTPTTTTPTSHPPQAQLNGTSQPLTTTSPTSTTTNTLHTPRRPTYRNTPHNPCHPHTHSNTRQGLFTELRTSKTKRKEKCNIIIPEQPVANRTRTITAYNTHQTACTHTTQNPINKPHSTECTTETSTSYDISEKPVNNRRLRQPTTARTQENTPNIHITTPYNYYINSTHSYKKSTASLHLHIAAQHIKTKHNPTNIMENNQAQPSSAPRGRRSNQRYRRGAHNATLAPSARLALTQHFAAKGRTQPPAATDPISLTISSYFSAPLGGRRVLEAVIPPHHDRADISADPIYFNHPSAREDLQHPLLLRPAAQGLNSVVIENYYVTGVHSTNSQNHASFYIYIYLPNDYDHTTDLIDVLTLQLDSMNTAGYPTSPLGIRDAQVTALLGDIQTSEPYDDPIDTMTLITPPQLSPYPPQIPPGPPR